MKVLQTAAQPIRTIGKQTPIFRRRAEGPLPCADTAWLNFRSRATQRRRSIAGLVGLWLWPHSPAHTPVVDLNDAIHQAGRQRMLSQRMAKACLALGQGVASSRSLDILNASMALFDRQLVELKAFAPDAAIQGTGAWRLERRWPGSSAQTSSASITRLRRLMCWPATDTVTANA